MIGKHNNGKCGYCGEEETVEHVLLHRQKYDSERDILREQNISNIHKSADDKGWNLLLEYVGSTRI